MSFAAPANRRQPTSRGPARPGPPDVRGDPRIAAPPSEDKGAYAPNHGTPRNARPAQMRRRSIFPKTLFPTAHLSFDAAGRAESETAADRRRRDTGRA